jgi:hypothetical protein
LLDPENFERFNDGILQASLLRASKREELNYSLEDDASLKMKTTLDNIIKYHNEDNGEALLEFTFALVTKKMQLKKRHLEDVYKKLLSLNNPIVSAFVDFAS